MDVTVCDLCGRRITWEYTHKRIVINEIVPNYEDSFRKYKKKPIDICHKCLTYMMDILSQVKE